MKGVVKLFNKYGAYNPLGGKICDEYRALTDKVLKEYPNIDIPELQMIILSSVDLPMTVARVKRGMKLREAEAKVEKRNANKKGDLKSV